MTRFQTVSWVEPAKPNEQSIGRFRSLFRCALDFDTIFLIHSLPGFNVGWMTLHPSTAWHSRWDRIGYIFDDHAHAPAPTRELLMVPRWSMGPTSISVQQSANLRSTDAASGPKQCAAVLGSRPPRDDPLACRIVRGRPCS